MSETPSHPKLLLASGSRYRAAVLEKLGLPFQQQASAADETPLAGEHPYDLVRRLAREKAAALAPTYPEHLIISSDQVALIDGQVLGKPGTSTRAVLQLQQLRGRTARFYTSLALLDNPSGRRWEDVVTTDVQFRQLTDAQLRNYVEREQPLDCAGAFKSEGLGISLFRGIQSSDPDALIGLPLIRLCDFLAEASVDVLAGG
ncbi:MAG: nucleoside triphosphate pyrophosphatase [Pseudomonadota bacterium]